MSAILVASPGAQLVGVWQVHLSAPGLSVIHQYPLEPYIIAERKNPRAVRPVNRGPIELQPLSPEDMQGVPREDQLTVRDAGGRVYFPSHIRLDEVRYEPAYEEIALREVPADAVINGSVWCALVVFASDLEAPAA